MKKSIIFFPGFVILALNIHLSSFGQSYRIDHDVPDTAYAGIFAHCAQSRIIGIGESAHGVARFHAWSLGFVTWLIKTGHCKAFVLEDNFASLRKVDAYVQGTNSNVNIDSLIHYTLYSIWQSKELLQLVEFVHSYNEGTDAANRVHIVGADMQNADGIYDVYNYCIRHNIPVQEITQNDLALIAAMGKDEKYNFKRLPSADKDRIIFTIRYFQAKFDTLSKASSPVESQEFIWALQDLAIVTQCYENETAGIFKWMKYRNEALAKNVAWVEKNIAAGRGVAFIAHNGHIGDASMSTGRYLKKLTPDYYTIFQDFMIGEVVNLYTGKKDLVNVAGEKKMLASYFQDLPGDRFFVDFTATGFKESPLYNYSKQNNRIHNFGATNNSTMDIDPGITCSAILLHKKL